MSAVTPVIRQEQEQEKKLHEAIAKVLDFSEIYESIEHAVKIANDALKNNKKESSQ